MIRSIILVLLTLIMSEELFSQTKVGRKKRRVETTETVARSSQSNRNKVSRPAKIRGPQNKAIAFLKEGSIYIGEYLGEDESQVSLKLITEDSISIDRSLTTDIYTPQNALIYNRAKFHPTEGLYMHFDWGGNFNREGGGLSTSVGLGYRLNKKWDLQAGIGVNNTTTRIRTNQFGFQFRNLAGAPLYIGGLYNITDSKARLFAFARTGPVFQFEFNNDNNLGYLFETGIGVNFASSTSSRIQFTLSNYTQYSQLDLSQIDSFGNPFVGTANIWLNRYAIRIAYTLY